MIRKNEKKKALKVNLICITYCIVMGIPIGILLEHVNNENIATAIFMFFSISVVLLSIYLDNKGKTTIYKSIPYNEEYEKFMKQIEMIH